MRLREWKYMNNSSSASAQSINATINASSSNTAPATTTGNTGTNTGFKNRLTKLIDYHDNNLANGEIITNVSKNITNYTLDYAEEVDDPEMGFSYTRGYKVVFKPNADWELKVYMDGDLLPGHEFSGNGWDTFVDMMHNFLRLPGGKTKKYQELRTLTESCAITEDFELYDFFLD